MAQINGTAGNDSLSGGPGDDIIHGLDGNDTIGGGLGADQLFGDAGNDTITISLQGGGPILADGGEGDDMLSASNGGGPNQSVTLLGGAGNDQIRLDGFARGNVIDAGAGDDRVTLGSTLAVQVTLGSGSDTLALQAINFAPAADGVVITDYTPGIDRIDMNFDRLLSAWDGNNPFAEGYIRLTADGADTLIQVDRNGGGDQYISLLRLQNVAPAAFSASDFLGYNPDGSPPAGATLNGTTGDDMLDGTIGADSISGNDGNDRINGLAGADTIDGGAGNDFINGGAGSDIIHGGAGNDFISDGQGGDQLYGDDGDDNISISLLGGGRLFADGGNGNDTIRAANGGGVNQSVTLLGGLGDDLITLDGFASDNVIDAGAGNDTVTIGSTLGVKVTLGDGVDTLIIASNAGVLGHVITDYTPGADKLSLDFSRILFSWDGNVNPFGSGFARLVSSGADTLLQIDQNGGGDSYATLLQFSNLAPAAFTAQDFGGFPPDGSVAPGVVLVGTTGNDTLTGTVGADTISGGDGNDQIQGGSGSDIISGGDGTDNLQGGPGDDTIHGDPGNDSLIDGLGADRLYGDAGDDSIIISLRGGGRIIADGGSGNDTISISNGGGSNQPVTALGGDGNDSYSLNGFARDNIIDAGAGDDKIMIGSMPAALITLGDGADAIRLESNFGPSPSQIVVTDFAAGVDHIDLNLTQVLTSWDRVSNPFAQGFVRFVQIEGDTLLQIDSSGGGDQFQTALVLTGVDAAMLTVTDTGGFDPMLVATAAMTGTTGNDVLAGTANWDTINGLTGDDVLSGGAGNDVLFGGSGNDMLTGGLGNDQIFGGKGIDTTIYSAARAQATVMRNPDVSFNVSSTADGIDSVVGAELFQFSDGLYSFRYADPGGTVVSNFAVNAGGWSSQDKFPRHVADVNGDGFADIVGFGIAGTLVSFGSANGTFSAPATAVADFGQNQGWSADNTFHRELIDVNHDGKADIVGFGIAGVLVSLAQAGGTFAAPVLGSSNFNPANGWSSEDAFARTLADVNGDGFADVVGFGVAGTFVALGKGDGTFGSANFALQDFGKNQGWTSDNTFHRTVADVNGDGKADIIGFGIAGTLVALGKADGTFAAATLAQANFGTNQGWSSQDAFARTVGDVNGDGMADVLGFGIAGTFVSYGQADGTLSAAGFDVSNFGKNQGWTSDGTLHRELADVNHDGLADIVGFGLNGVFVSPAFVI